jgi:hypothetical protein
MRGALALSARAATLTPATVNEADRTVDVIAATGAGVQRRDARGPFIERLDMQGFEPVALVGASVLNSHKQGDLADVLGVVVAAWREGDKLMARLLIEHEATWKRVKAGILRHVSIGYEVARFIESRDPQTGARVLTAAQWTPREVSFVPVPADTAAVTRGKPKMHRYIIDENGFLVELDAAGQVLRRSAAAVQFVRTGLSEEDVDELRADEESAEETSDEAPDVAALRSTTDAALAAERDAVPAETREARAARLASLRTRSPHVRAVQTRTPSNDDPAVRAERMGEAIYARFNPTHQLSEPARQFAHMSVVDLARSALRHSGASISGLSADTLITRALSTSDFPLALGNFTNRELRTGYDAAPSALRQAARQTTAKDFRAKQKIMVETSAQLEKVNELGEFKHGGMVEAAESYRIDTYGKIVTISRQTLVNDDLGWTSDLARGLGREAASFEARFLVELLESNAGFGPTMSDGDPLFDEAHANVTDGVGLFEMQNALDAGRIAMRKQRSLNGDVIGIGPKFLIVPTDMETEAEMVLTAITPNRVDDVNPFSHLTLLVEPRLTDGERFYLAADPAQVEGLEYAYLAGAPGPQTETKTGFEVDGVSVKVRLDYGAGFVDWRGWQMNPGLDEAEGG